MKITIEFDDKLPLEDVVKQVTSAYEISKAHLSEKEKYEKPQLLNEVTDSNGGADISVEDMETKILPVKWFSDETYKHSKEIQDLEDSTLRNDR